TGSLRHPEALDRSCGRASKDGGRCAAAKDAMGSPMDITIRPAREADAPECGRICYEGFRAVTERHGYPLVFGSHEIATRRLAGFIAHPSVYAIVAEANDRERRIVGFN